MDDAVGDAPPTRDERSREPTNTGPRFAPRAHGPRFTPTSDAHAHAHAHAPVPRELVGGPAPGLGSFPHEKLDAYRVAIELAGLSKTLAEKIPRGHRSVADHLLRAASNTVLLLAEGANRRGAAQKRQRFVESRGECAEVAAAADLFLVLGIGSEQEAGELKHLASRVLRC